MRIIQSYLQESKNWSDFYLVTSNENKLKEYKSFGLPIHKIEKGKDLPEVDGTPLEVVIHKAKDAGTKRIIEDTSFHVKGKDIGINIRWLLKEIPKLAGSEATWQVLIGLNDGEEIKIYEGIVKGILVKPSYKVDETKSFGFDPFFKPNGSDKTLEELGKDKVKYSSRKIAITNLLKDKHIHKIKLSKIPVWKGKYQH